MRTEGTSFRRDDEEDVLVNTPGYCMNAHSCSIAASGAAVRVRLEDAFLCPECGGSLAPPALDKMGARRRLALLVAAFVCVAIGAGATVLARGGFFVRPAPVPEETATISLAPAVLGGPSVSFTQDSVAAPSPETLPADEPMATSHPPRSRTAKELRMAVLPGASRANPAGHHHANVHMSVSIPLVAGGLPDYPEQYEEDGRSGSVTVACALEADGGTSDCRTSRVSGGRIFDVAVHSWLELKDVRFQPPGTRRRAPIRSVTLTIHFVGDGPEPQ